MWDYPDEYCQPTLCWWVYQCSVDSSHLFPWTFDWFSPLPSATTSLGTRSPWWSLFDSQNCWRENIAQPKQMVAEPEVTAKKMLSLVRLIPVTFGWNYPTSFVFSSLTPGLTNAFASYPGISSDRQLLNDWGPPSLHGKQLEVPAGGALPGHQGHPPSLQSRWQKSQLSAWQFIGNICWTMVPWSLIVVKTWRLTMMTTIWLYLTHVCTE